MKAALHRHPVLFAAFGLALALTLFFAGRFTWAAIYWSQHREMPVQGWMTIGYVGHSWGLDPRALDAAAGTPRPEPGHPLTLDEIARTRGVPVTQVIAEVTAAVQALKAAEPSL